MPAVSKELDPLGPLPSRDRRWFIPGHGAGSSRTANLSGRATAVPESAPIPAPREVFPTWRRAQLEFDRLAGESPPAPRVLRTTGFLRPEVAQRVADWFTGEPAAPAGAVRRSYRALERETARLSEIVHRAPSSGGLGVRVNHVRNDSDPYHDAAELCAELREHGSMTLTTIATEAPHPLLGGQEGGGVDQLRVVHDVFGHAALGVGFDLQSEFATWLQCRTLFSRDARGAAFCELVGATTTYIVTGEKPGLRADLPPGELVAACDVQAMFKTTLSETTHRSQDQMRRAADPLALDPLGPIGIGPIACAYSPSDPLALDPLSPVSSTPPSTCPGTCRQPAPGLGP